MSAEGFATPEYIEITAGDKTAYVPLEEAVANPELSAQVVQQALTEATDWCGRYAAFFERINEPEALAIVQAIVQVREKMSSEPSEDGMDFDESE